MSRLFGRVCAVTVGTRRITGLRMAFKIAKWLARDPNTLELTVTNLSAETRAALQEKDVPVTVEAGYAGTAGSPGTSQVIFSGTARRVTHTHDGTEWETKLTSGDGEKAIRDGRVNEALAPGATMKDALGSLAKGLGVAFDKASAGDLEGAFDSFANGVSLHGPAAPQLDKLMATAGRSWSIQDGTLQILRPDGTTAEAAVLLNAASGLVGSPEFGEKNLLTVKSLLQPDLRPGRKVQLEAAAVKGLFRVEKVTHSGDTAGSEWYSACELRRI